MQSGKPVAHKKVLKLCFADFIHRIILLFWLFVLLDRSGVLNAHKQSKFKGVFNTLRCDNCEKIEHLLKMQ